ncbi:MAG TPA: lipocalin-like domain-containing protein [Candidatus Solibacter sp.]|nr:lipocalin-like domain-containing protein [Candidatus Solibacter sp.]
MQAQLCWALAAIAVLAALPRAQSAEKHHAQAASAKEKLIGAWRLVSLDEPGSGGKIKHVTDQKGMLIYTRDGHMSVQLMYPPSASSLTNDYVKNGYEASFGSYDVDEAKHTVIHHVQGSITEGLVGKNLPRVYQFAEDGHLIIKSANPAEHWQVVWEHY